MISSCRGTTTIGGCLKQILGKTNSIANIRFKSAIASSEKLPNYNSPFSLDSSSQLRAENSQFMLAFPDLIADVTDFAANQYGLRDAAKHFQTALEYNVPHGKKLRGLTTVIAYKDLIGKERCTPKNVQHAHILGWCIELLQSMFLMSDDIIDCSEIRHNKPCWYKVRDVQTIAINDIQMIENACYLVLKRYFEHLPSYINMFQLLHETAMTTFIGQSLDFQSAKAGITSFSMEKHVSISNHKTSHFGFYTPIALPMILAGYKNEKTFESIKEVCNNIGHFYQVQNDFFDWFSDSSVLQKPGTDIEDGKCTWLAVLAMQHGTEKQRQILTKCYGKNDPECINKVKQVYNDLCFPEMYSRYEDTTYNNIKQKIEQFLDSNHLLRNVLIKTLDRTFNHA